MRIRQATIDDLEGIVRIYNQAIHNRQTGDLAELSADDRRDWFDEHDDKNFPVFVAEINGTITGWLSLSKYRPGREAFRHVAEISYYIDNEFIGKGIGKSLMEYALDYLAGTDIDTLISIILSTNTTSIAFTGRFGFDVWGFLPGVAAIDGKRIDHIYMGKKIK